MQSTISVSTRNPEASSLAAALDFKKAGPGGEMTEAVLLAGALNLPAGIVATWSAGRLREVVWEALRISEGKREIAQREYDALLAVWERLRRGGRP